MVNKEDMTSYDTTTAAWLQLFDGDDNIVRPERFDRIV